MKNHQAIPLHRNPVRLSPRLRSTLRRSAVRPVLASMFATSTGQVALVLSGVCAARILGPHGRGELAFFNLVPLILTVLGALGVPVACTYFIARDPLNARGIVRVAMRFALAQCAVLLSIQGAVVFAFYHDSSTTVKIAALASLALTPAKLAQDYGNCILQGGKRYRLFNITRTIPAGAYAIAVSIAFLVGGAHLLAVTLCFVITVVGASIVTLWSAFRSLPAEAHPNTSPTARALLRFGTRAQLGAVYPTEAFQLDQALVGLALSRTALGTYTVGVSFTNLPRFIAQSVGLVAYPHIASSNDTRHARRAVWRFFWLVAAISLVMCIALELATPTVLPFVFGHAFRRAVGVTQILLISSFVVSIRRVLSDGMRGAGYPILGTIGELTGLALLVPAVLIMIPLAGLEGAAAAVVIASSGGFTALLVGVYRTRLR